MKYQVKFETEFLQNKHPGKFIVLEGIDGSGKTTQSPLVAKALEDKGYKVFQTKEPTHGSIGKFIYQILRGEVKVPPTAMQYLFVADRAAHAEEIENYLKKGYIVLADRYFWSSVAYGIVDMKVVGDYYLAAYSILSFYYKFIVPDITFFLDIEPENALSRLQHSGKEIELYETKEKLSVIQKGYEFLIKRFPEQFIRIDALQPIESLTDSIVSHVLSLNTPGNISAKINK